MTIAQLVLLAKLGCPSGVGLHLLVWNFAYAVYLFRPIGAPVFT